VKLIVLMALALAGCEGSHLANCYDNHTCDDGLTCVWVRGHGTSCVTPDDVRVAEVNRQWRSLLVDGGTK
jgi:hypothetical protein